MVSGSRMGEMYGAVEVLMPASVRQWGLRRKSAELPDPAEMQVIRIEG